MTVDGYGAECGMGRGAEFGPAAGPEPVSALGKEI